MQTCIIAVGILLATQVGDGGSGRYPSDAAETNGTGEVAAGTPETGVSSSSNPLRGAAAPPTAAENPPARSAAPATGLTKVIKPAEFLSSLAKPAGDESLSGKPLTLSDAVQGARTRAEQTRRVQSYWELSQAVTDYRLAALEQLELQTLSSGLGQPSDGWATAQQSFAARRRVAENAVKVAQLRLHDALGRAAFDELPLPSDLPHCGAYETKYKQIFGGRTSSEAEQLSQLLPLEHQELEQRAADAAAAREWLILVRGQHGPQSNDLLLLNSYHQLALQRRAFVAAAYQYNENIARYTQLAVPQEIGTVRLVAMLIQSDQQSDTASQSGSIRRATAEESTSRNADSRYQPRTFAEEQRTKARRVPSKEESPEHSILLNP